MATSFEWNEQRNLRNQQVYGVSFESAEDAFFDPQRLIISDDEHSIEEERWYCIGKIDDGRIITVRFTIRNTNIRIFGAGEWRKWRKKYEKSRCFR